VTIKGLLVDKIAGVIRCDLKGNVVQPIEKDKGSLELTTYDGFVRQLDSKSLCYHIFNPLTVTGAIWHQH